MFSASWLQSSSSSDHLLRAPLDSSHKIPEGTAWKKPLDFIRDETRLTLWPVDPYRIFASVRIANSDQRINSRILTSLTIRVLDITHSPYASGDEFEDQTNQHHWESLFGTASYTFDIALAGASSWYIPLWDSERIFTAFLGGFPAETPEVFRPVLKSNVIRTPSGKIHPGPGALHHHVGRERKEIVPISPSNFFLKGLSGTDTFHRFPGSSESPISSSGQKKSPANSSEYRSRT
ncbi:MAG: DUF4912 domain-containing protein [Leptospirillum sp.]